MRIAIPISGGQISRHFGHSEEFLFADADMEKHEVVKSQVEKAPEHVPGFLPRWLKDRYVDVVIAFGMGNRARDLLTASSVQVVTGISTSDPAATLTDFLSGNLETGPGGCDHSEHACDH
jgi:predicted Fe-Mo cluster-binding NifX family protein